LVEDVQEVGGEINATDAARSKAEELEIDLATVEGTGANERITVGDVDNAAKGEGGKAE
ncbi:MAG: E3 binding domain-containing protein, partial [Rubrobacter sp.]|nr:E3 binding domain-containing protein [Rubrobacter sp.]